MKTFRSISIWAAALAALVFTVGGCAWLDRFKGAEVDKSPSELMYDGLTDLERGRYASATKAFQTLKDRYPYSELAVEAKLRLADTLYRRELYEEAYSAYDEFERLHPTNPLVPYALYQKGMCHFSRTRGIDRDQTPARMARDEFERLLQRFPDSEYSSRARRKLTECYASLARQELFIADFYLKKKQYRAARDRYRYLLENFPDFGQYHSALQNLNVCIVRLQELEGRDESKSWWRKIIPMEHGGDRVPTWE